MDIGALTPADRNVEGIVELMLDATRNYDQPLTAERLFSFLRLYGRVHPARILDGKQTLDFSSGKQAEPSFIHAAIYAVADWLRNEGTARDEQLPHLVDFLASPGLDPEFRVLFLRQIRSCTDLSARLRALPAFRALAGELVGLHAGLYAS